MKWTYSIRNKTKAAILLAIVLGLTMLTNLLERKRFRQLEQSFSSIFEDRLMAESYLFHLYKNLKNEQDLLQLAPDGKLDYASREKLATYRANRTGLMEQYAKTYLTEEEEMKFDQLQAIFSRIGQLEKEIAGQQATASILSAHSLATAEAFTTLSALSDIQTAEGAELREKSKRIILGSVSTSQFEMTILIVIAIIIQALIFSSRSLQGSQPQNPGLN
ncbi:MAG: hypothetical protein H6557_03670 [Lewinellaceae bacterium]|nr:hypothetical protein [Phaeodactylibacter sp.]MCB9035696.1 hypothetical protein [Lewinellaceae bacterium]